MGLGFWQRWFGRGTEQRAVAQDISFWRLQALFNNFKRILLLNNAVLEEMAKMERALGGEYVFDRSFLEASVSTIANRVHHVAYSLNALTGNRHIALYDRYQEIRTLLDDILVNNVRALADEAVLPLCSIGWEHEPLVGMDLVCLAELFYHPWIAAIDGLAVTQEGLRALGACLPVTEEVVADQDDVEPLQSPVSNSRRLSEVRAALLDHLHHLLEAHPGVPVQVVVNRIEEDEEPLKELACFQIEIKSDKREASVYRITGQERETVGTLALADRGAAPVDQTKESAAHLLLHGLEQIGQLLDQDLKGMDGPVHCALFLHPQPPFVLEGTLQTRPMPGNPFAAMDGLVAEVSGPREAQPDLYLLRRIHPFELVQSRIPTRPSGHRFAGGQLATDSIRENPQLAHGSGLVAPGLLKELAETAMVLERLFGAPLEVRWQLWSDNVCRITRLRPLVLEDAQEGEEPLDADQAVLLCQGGQTGQSGVAAGPVVHVDESTDPKTVPPGAVVVTRIASPNLTPVLQRAAALITEFGTAAGHLATVARELRLPSIFGLPQVCTLLPAGIEVTVNGGETRVYAGIVEPMLRYQALALDLTPQDREYRMLRRLLRFIQPLTLVNPETQDFSATNCRSFHDIIHFCHETAVDELAHFQERRPGLGALRTRSLELGLPMDLRLLDVGGGIAPQAGERPLPDQISSAPFAAFLQGVADPRAWCTDTPSLGMRDILAGMPRSMGLLAAPADTLGANLAIIGREYCNLSLRMGYHFSVIDAFLGEDISRNYVYFRFVGGLADPERRGRRARFIGRVLAAMEFKTSLSGDLITARLKQVEPEILHTALVALGALTIATRQQDTNMRNEAEVERRFAQFAAQFLPGFGHDSTQLEENGDVAH